jgi:hypothetical protein
MNLSSMSVFVRAQADTDSTDASDELLTVYARAAYRDIQAKVFPWPDKKTATVLTTVADQAFYSFAGLPGGNIQFLISISSSDDPLMFVSLEQYNQLVLGSSGSSGDAVVYAADNDGIYLWPTPAASGTNYAVTGYREFADWPSGSSEPDLPRGFDEPICWFMLSKFYESQEDLELANRYMGTYAQGVAQQVEAALRGQASSAGPRIFGNQSIHSTMYSDFYENWVKRSVEGI